MSDTLPVRIAGPVELAPPSVHRAQTAIRYREALEARAAGAEYYQIAEMLGISERSAEELVKRALKATLREPADDVRKLELKRLDMFLQVYMAKALDGHGPSLDRCLAIMERRARLEGIDAPIEMDYASIRTQFFQPLAEILPREMMVEVLQKFSEMRA